MSRFNLRVYALITNEQNEILVSDECRYGKFFTKFPGGGVEDGEGILAALKRELSEELNLTEYPKPQFFYFNEFHQASAFDNSNLVAFYYRVSIQKKEVPLSSEHYEIPFFKEQEKQRWVGLRELKVSNLTFPIDRIVLEKFQKEYELSI
ncbi:MAG: NUDIX hydrolase [Flavobacteriales bacterium]